jgi:D-beta-D-heptose 7-phosphate kinase/D-beta-D-heptose 1-phosphate adenosyltransferase
VTCRVALNSDRSVRELKGEGRPIVPAAERSETLLALEAVDRVVVYDETTPIEIVKALLPDVLVKGADWAADQIVGRAEVEAAGGRVVRVEMVPGRSTTSVLERIRRG